MEFKSKDQFERKDGKSRSQSPEGRKISETERQSLKARYSKLVESYKEDSKRLFKNMSSEINNTQMTDKKITKALTDADNLIKQMEEKDNPYAIIYRGIFDKLKKSHQGDKNVFAFEDKRIIDQRYNSFKEAYNKMQELYKLTPSTKDQFSQYCGSLENLQQSESVYYDERTNLQIGYHDEQDTHLESITALQRRLERVSSSSQVSSTEDMGLLYRVPHIPMKKS